jgi:methyltransferase
MRAEGAFEPAGDVYKWLRIVYPACFIAMAAEGTLHGPAARPLVVAGLLVFATAKALKTWAIVSLGTSWSFHVLVRRGHVLITRGPYRYLRHPNYVAIAGEIAGMAMIVAAPITGAGSLLIMAELLRRRIALEERALGLRP